MMLITVHCKLYTLSCSYEDEDIGVVDQGVESDPPSSDHLTLQVVAPGVVDQDADSFFRRLGSAL